MIQGVNSLAKINRQHNIMPQLLSKWKAEFLECAPIVFEPDERRSEDRAHIRELKRLLEFSKKKLLTVYETVCKQKED